MSVGQNMGRIKRPMDQGFDGGGLIFNYPQPQQESLKRPRLNVNPQPSPRGLTHGYHHNMSPSLSNTSSMAPPPTTLAPSLMHLSGAGSSDNPTSSVDNSWMRMSELDEIMGATASEHNPLLLDKVSYPPVDHLEQDLPQYQPTQGTILESEPRPRNDEPFNHLFTAAGLQDQGKFPLTPPYSRRSGRDSLGSNQFRNVTSNALDLANFASDSQSACFDSAYHSRALTPRTRSVFSNDNRLAVTPQATHNLSADLDALDFQSQTTERAWDLFQQDDNSQVPLWGPYPTPQSTVREMDALAGPPWLCKYCDESSFKNKSEFKKHRLRHEKPFRCEIPDCTRKGGFSTRNDLDRHRKSLHKIVPKTSTDKTYKCAAEACARVTKVWPRADNFRQHCSRKHKDLHLETLVQDSECYEPHDDFGNDSATQERHKEMTTTNGDAEQRKYNIPRALAHVLEESEKEKFATTTRGTLAEEQSRLGEDSTRLPVLDVPKANEKSPCTQPSSKQNRIKEQGSSTKASTTIHRPKETPGLYMNQNDVREPRYLPQVQPNTVPGVQPACTHDSTDPKARRPLDSNNHSSTSAKPPPTKHCRNADLLGQGDGVPPTTSNPKSSHVHSGSTILSASARKMEELKNTCPEQFETLNKMLVQMLQAQGHAKPGEAKIVDNSMRDTASKEAFKCPNCPKIKKTASDFRKHRLRHLKPYCCTLELGCLGRYGSKNDWKRHERTSHEDPSFMESYICPLPLDYRYQKTDEEKECEKMAADNKRHVSVDADDGLEADLHDMEMAGTWPRCQEDGVPNTAKCHKFFNEKSEYYKHLHFFHEYLDPQLVDHEKSQTWADPRKDGPKWYKIARAARTEARKGCKIGRNGTRGFWCGFCNEVITIPKRLLGPKAWDSRYNHIHSEHFQPLINKFHDQDEMWLREKEGVSNDIQSHQKASKDRVEHLIREREMIRNLWVMYYEQKTIGELNKKKEDQDNNLKRDGDSSDEDSDSRSQLEEEDGEEETSDVGEDGNTGAGAQDIDSNMGDYAHDEQDASGEDDEEGEPSSAENTYAATGQKPAAECSRDSSNVFYENGWPILNYDILKPPPVPTAVTRSEYEAQKESLPPGADWKYWFCGWCHYERPLKTRLYVFCPTCGGQRTDNTYCKTSNTKELPKT